MARQLEHFDNLVALFLTRAQEKADLPFLWAKREGEWRASRIADIGVGREPAGRVEVSRPADERANDRDDSDPFDRD